MFKKSVSFFILKNEAISYEHARERVRQQAKGARGCAGERKRMSATGHEQTQRCLRKTISLPLSLTLSFNFIRIKYITLI